MSQSDAKLQRRDLLKGVLVLLGIVLTFAAVITIQQAIQTLNRLDVVENERDQWQRPTDIIQLLDLRNGSVVADLGSGSGYFSVKLSRVVGSGGKVLAIDIRRLPLIFLWIRTFLHHQPNVHVILGNPDDPHLPPGAVDAVLILNTYHELANPQRILAHVIRSLRSGGRLVIVDRGPRSGAEESREIEMEHHVLDPSSVEGDIRRSGLELIKREDRFIDLPLEDRPTDLPDDDLWWFIVARKP